VPDPTSFPVAVVAETIMRTIELGVTITDAAVDGDVTVVFCDLLTEGRQHCPQCGNVGVYRERRHARVLTRRRLTTQQPIKTVSQVF
jgi:transposase